MFTIEHDFDATIVTLIDEADGPLNEDVVISAKDDRVTLKQWHPERDDVCEITLSIAQLRDLQAALDLPEGVYQLRPADTDDAG